MRFLVAIPILLFCFGVSAQELVSPDKGVLSASPMHNNNTGKNGTDTFSTIQPGFYFDPYSAYTTTSAQAAGDPAPGWRDVNGLTALAVEDVLAMMSEMGEIISGIATTKAPIYMTVRPPKSIRRHCCSR